MHLTSPRNVRCLFTILGLLAGLNGCGKRTLLRLITRQEEPIKGRVQLGPHNINPTYFAQNRADALLEVQNIKQSVLNTMLKAALDAQLFNVKALLGRTSSVAKLWTKRSTINHDL